MRRSKDYKSTSKTKKMGKSLPKSKKVKKRSPERGIVLATKKIVSIIDNISLKLIIIKGSC